MISDDLAPEQEEGEVYDAAVIDAVKRFQLRHGLEATGSVDARTLKALNVPVASASNNSKRHSSVCSAWISFSPNVTWS